MTRAWAVAFVNVAVLEGDQIKFVDEHGSDVPDCPGLLRSLLGFDISVPNGETVNVLVQLAASIPNFLCQEQVTLGEGYLKQPFVVRDGYLDLPSGPGLGVELDDVAMKANDKLGHDWRNREEYDRDDGSVVDW